MAETVNSADAVVAQANDFVEWFRSNTDQFISGLLNVAIILLVAILLRALVGRIITHVMKRMVGSRQRLSNAKAKATKAVRKSADDAANTADRQLRQQQRADTIRSVLRSVATFVIFGVAFVMILGEFGINLAPIIASASVLGLAIGFGAQSLVQDFLSGIFMMIEDQYGVGDTVDIGDAVGTVEEVTLRITKVRDLDGGLWHVRNGEIMRVCNMNQDWANAVVDVPLDYSVDLTKAHEVLEQAVTEFAAEPANMPRILAKPEVNGVVSIGNGAVTVRVVVKTKPGEQWALGRALRGLLKQRFDAEGIRVAYPLLPATGAGAAKEG
ncbi:small conductance mechanosensitive channel [Tamaricihabitans halophyticus]|uniref:Small conductance mechanosensitive channel n=1 Tax=Tamaricihabitans halophyticus TaxID=1262583 RepID=A0A4R2QY13_9PSEU|nr:mechanosensitive ion channel family protein [Tamaricihabitans halophyticus]TCP55100.1 small conductance mechanosensitive channel [Tamaricihabitans halophyticus]